jgi:Ca2+-binding EF-hand superfamily protein
MFQAIDADSDGVITKTELRRAAMQLRKLDTDKNGELTLAEVTAAGGPGGPPGRPFGDVAAMVDQLMLSDKDGNGMLSADELPQPMAQQMLLAADKDGDGALNKAELTAGMEEMRNRFPGGPPGWPGGPHGLAGGPQGPQDGPGGDSRQLMGQMMRNDKDGDGQLSPDEVPEQQMSFFRNGDKNRDGFIDKSELQMVVERSGRRLQASLARGDGKNRPGRTGGAIVEEPSDEEGPERGGRRGDKDR